MMHLSTKTTYVVICDGCGRHAGPAADTMTVALLQGHELEWVSITSDAGDVRHLCRGCQVDRVIVEECLRAGAKIAVRPQLVEDVTTVPQLLKHRKRELGIR